MSRRKSVPSMPEDPVIVNPAAIPDSLYVTPEELCEALQISRLTLWTWTKNILAGDSKSYRIRPVVFSYRKDGSPATVRYQIDSLGLYPGTFLSRFRKQIRAQNRAAAKALRV